VTSSRLSAGSQLFCDHILQGLVFQTQFSKHLLQPAVIGLKLIQSPHVRRLHTSILSLPLVKRGRADTALTANVRDGPTSFSFLEHPDNLNFLKSRFPHRFFRWLLCQKSQPLAGTILEEGYNRVVFERLPEKLHIDYAPEYLTMAPADWPRSMA
jgi:hypothetical protein